MLLDGYQKAFQGHELERVFLVTPDTPQTLATAAAFSEAFTGTMRDMQSCGIASIHTGVPLWMLKEKRALVQQTFQGTGFLASVCRLVEVRTQALREKGCSCLCCKQQGRLLL